ncbi:MAG: LacI family transcriptional regulator, partial [bacterium]
IQLDYTAKKILISTGGTVYRPNPAMVAGKLNCTVECNPLIGPQMFNAVEAIMGGKTLPKQIKSEEGVFDQSQAKDVIGSRQY